MSDTEDTTTRTGLWVVATVVIVLLASLLSWQVHRALRPAPTAEAPAERVSAEVDALADELMDVPLTGDLVGVLYFASGEATLPPDATAEVAKVLEALHAAPELNVMLSGFHDASGDTARNAALARQRALAARGALLAAGVEAARIRLRKPEQTLADGPPQEARRVEMRLVR